MPLAAGLNRSKSISADYRPPATGSLSPGHLSLKTRRPMQTIRKSTPADLGLLMLTAFLWAGAFPAIKIAVAEISPLWLAAGRVTIGFLVLLPWALWRGWIWPQNRKVLLLVLALSLLNVVVPFYLISWAEQTINASVTSLLMGTGPIFALIGGHLFTRDDRATGPKLIAVVLGFAGILIIVGLDALRGMGSQNLAAQAAALLGSLCYVASGLIVRRIDLPPVRLACLALGTGTIILLASGFVIDGLPARMPSETVVVALVYLGVLPTGIAYILRFHLIQTVGYSTFALGINMVPVFGVVLGFIILSEPLRPEILIALALVVSALFVARLSDRK